MGRNIRRYRRQNKPVEAGLLLGSPLSQVGAAVASVFALTYASAFPGLETKCVDGLTVCSGLPTLSYPRGGVCIGAVFLTGDFPSDCVIAHEVRHTVQWERYGLLFPFLYWSAGANPLTNRFEVEAGLTDGGYLPQD